MITLTSFLEQYEHIYITFKKRNKKRSRKRLREKKRDIEREESEIDTIKGEKEREIDSEKNNIGEYGRGMKK